MNKLFYVGVLVLSVTAAYCYGKEEGIKACLPIINDQSEIISDLRDRVLKDDLSKAFFNEKVFNLKDVENAG